MKADGGRHAPLAFDDETFRALGHRLVDQIADGLARIPSGPVTRCESASAVRAALDLDAGLPEHGTPPGPLLEETATHLFGHSLFNAHPRFFGYITAPPAPIGILGDLLAAAVNPNVGAWALSPAATWQTSWVFSPVAQQRLNGTCARTAYGHRRAPFARQILERLQRGGNAFVSNAVVAGRYMLRACIVNFHTQLADVEALVDIVVREGHITLREFPAVAQEKELT
jgi:glutamate/tyrosine decarboxylase-like PLP-dependent enzyme